MGARWSLTERDRQILRRLIIGESYDSSKPLLEQLAEKIGPIFPNGPLARLLAGQPKPEKPVEEEWEKMPDDYPSLVEWSRLPVEEKKKVHEALRHNRKIYIVQYSEPSRRGTLDSITLEKQHLQKIMETQW